MKNFISKHISAAAVLTMGLGMTLTGCSGLLDQAPYGTFTADQIDSTNIDGLLASSYNGLEAHFFGNNAAFAGPSTNWIFDVRSDDALKGGGALSMEANINLLETSVLNSDNVSCLNKWQNNFYAISRVHKAMQTIQSMRDPSRYDEEVAELKFLRAFYYFDLVKIFKYIPYLTETSLATEVPNTLMSQDEICGNIISDLEEAYKGLDPAPVNESYRDGHACKEAAAALLAKVYAQRGAYNNGSVDWKKVEAWCDTVINSKKYYVYDNYGDMSKIEFNNRGESIFALQCSTDNDYAHFNWSNLLNTTIGAENNDNYDRLYGSGDDFFLASQNLVNAFRTNADGLPYLDGAPDDQNVSSDPTKFDGYVDPRLDYTVGRIGMPWKSTDDNPCYYTDKCVRAPALYSEYSGKKFLEATNKAKTVWPCGASALNFIFLRYSDILLLHAEALVEQGRWADAMNDVNEVRNKAVRSLEEYKAGTYTPVDLDGLNAYYVVKPYTTNTWTSQEYARKAVRMERRLELAMEGGRWFDLLRWNVCKETMNNYFKSESKIRSYLGDASVTEKEYYLPVPKDEITNSNGLYSDPDNQ